MGESNSIEVNKKKKYSNYLWVEKFRPGHVKNILLPEKQKRVFLKFVEEGQIPNLLLYSPTPGSGKTTLAKALCEDIGASYLYINASLETGIDTLRDKITKFASTRSFNGAPKIVILDEADGLGMALQKGLRASIEEFFKVCRFILTCNYLTQIIEPLQSRCQSIDMNMTNSNVSKEMKPKIARHLGMMLDFEKVEYTTEVLPKIVDTYYPDIRKMVNLCHMYSNYSNGIIDNEIFTFEQIDQEFYQLLLNKKAQKARKYINEKSYNFDVLFTSLFREFVPLLPVEVQAPAIILINDYQYKHAFCIDSEINFMALMLELMTLY